MSSPKEIGNLFEKYCFSLIKNDPIFCAKKVWMWRDYPYKDVYGFKNIDLGVDIVFSTGDLKGNPEGHVFVQCKYRSNKLSKGDCEAVEVMAGRAKADFMVMTNSSKVSKNIDLSKVRVVSGLNPIMKFTLEKPVYQKRVVEELKLRPYQEKCLKDLEGFEEVVLNLPCGLGKTLIAMKHLKGMDKVLIFAPTLYLLDSIGRRFLDYRSPEGVLLVGSDTTLDPEDQSGTPIIFKQTTSPLVIKKFLEGSKNNVVLCTYASYDLLREYDFSEYGVFYDESHRFNGGESGSEYIKGKKTLFASASPGKGGIWDSIPTIEPYTFEEGVEDGYLSQYEIWLSLVGDVKNYATNPNIKVVLDQEGTLGYKSLEEKLSTLAVAVSIVKAFVEINQSEKEWMRKTLVYSNSNAKSKKLKDLVEALVRVFGVEKVGCYYTDSTKSISSRESTIKAFLEEDFGILFSCRIFSEGVNIPEIDSVVFAESRKSVRDIIQSVGRCLRVHPSKVRKIFYDKKGVVLKKECKAWVILPCVKDHTEFEITKSIIRSLGSMDHELKTEIRKGRKISIGGKKECFAGREAVEEWSAGKLEEFYKSVEREVINGYTNSEKAYREFLEVLESIGWKMIGEYVNIGTKVELECSNKHCIKITPNGVKNGHRCVKCARLDPEIANIEFLQLLHSIGWEAKEAYINSRTKISLLCPMGHIVKISPGRFKTGNRCSMCSGNNSENAKIEFLTHIEKIGWKCIGQYVNNRTKISLMCSSGHTIEMRPWGVKSGSRCSICAGKNPENAKKEFLKISKEIGWELAGEYINTSTKIPMVTV